MQRKKGISTTIDKLSIRPVFTSIHSVVIMIQPILCLPSGVQ